MNNQKGLDPVFLPRHATRDGIVVDHIGHVDVSSWASGVSKPWGDQIRPGRAKRPEPTFEPAKTLPITNLDAIKPVVVSPARKEDIIRPGSTKFDKDEHAAKMVKRTIGIALMFENLYKKGVIKKAKKKKVEPTQAPRSVLENCEATDPETIVRLRANEIPRD